MWPHTLTGLVLLGLVLFSGSWFAVLVAVPVLAGLVLAIPFGVITSVPKGTASGGN